MKPHAFRVSVLAVGAAALALALFFFLLPSAASQALLISPNLNPIGVGAAGNNSTVWFHEPSSGRVTACQTISGSGQNAGLSGIQCVATKLP